MKFPPDYHSIQVPLLTRPAEGGPNFGEQPGMYVLPASLRAELARPMGPVLTTEEALPRVRAHVRGKIITVGDVVTRTLLERGVKPNIAIVDYKTQRQDDKALEALVQQKRIPVIPVRNPAGEITEELWEGIIQALQAPSPSVVIHVVEGEEDLAALPAILMAPVGSLIVYGQPPATDLGIHKGGMVTVEVTPAVRTHVQLILQRMEVR